MDDVVLWIVVGTALAFDFTNGFHDTANAVATSISTRAIPPKLAVGLASILNFVGAFLSLQVAATIATGIVNADLVTPAMVFAGLVGAIAWNLATWYFGLPASSSHALIGGVVGAAFAASGPDAIFGGGLFEKVIVPALVAPVVAFLTAGASRLEARIDLSNVRAKTALRKIGAVQEGILRRSGRRGHEYIDQALWAVLKDAWEFDSLPPAVVIH